MQFVNIHYEIDIYMASYIQMDLKKGMLSMLFT